MKKNVEGGKKANPNQTFEKSLQARIGAFGGEEKLSWIYGNDIEKVWQRYLVDEKTGVKSAA